MNFNQNTLEVGSQRVTYENAKYELKWLISNWGKNTTIFLNKDIPESKANPQSF